ncbi:unnamed protein product [Lampetra planeri]
MSKHQQNKKPLAVSSDDDDEAATQLLLTPGSVVPVMEPTMGGPVADRPGVDVQRADDGASEGPPLVNTAAIPGRVETAAVSQSPVTTHLMTAILNTTEESGGAAIISPLPHGGASRHPLRRRAPIVVNTCPKFESSWPLGSKTRSKLVEIFPEWKTKRIEILKMLAGMIVQLKKRMRDGNISKAAGSSASIGGGIMLIIGLALIPVTFGASLGLSIAGTVMGVAGGLATAGASIAMLVMNKALTKQATENIEQDKIASENLAEAVRSVNSAASELEIVTMDTLVSERVSLKGGTEPTGNGEKLGAAAGGFFASAAMNGILSSVLWIVVSSMVHVIDVASMIKTGVDLHKGSPSEIAAYWQEMYDILKLHLIGMVKINDYVEIIKK